MHDGYNRTIDYLRISLTDRCNFRCAYCMPSEGVKLINAPEILSYEELLRLITIFHHCGITKVRLTGGEPLVRKGVDEFISALTALGMLSDLSMTTNGSLLAPVAADLKAAGLNRVNISLDTADSSRFHEITGQDMLQATLDGIKSALTVGLTPVKINVVLTTAFTETDLAYFIDLVCNHPIAVRFIEYMPIGHGGIGAGMTTAEVKKLLTEAGGGPLEIAAYREGNGPARYCSLPHAKGVFGFITPLSEHFCGACNRIRLTADGKLRPCLLSNDEFDIKTPLRAGASDRYLAELFTRAIQAKPSGHSLYYGGTEKQFKRKMSQIGG